MRHWAVMRMFSGCLERLDLAERRRTATPSRTLPYSGLFFVVPVIFSLLLPTLRGWGKLLESAGAVTLWLLFVVFASVFTFGGLAWQRHVPIKAQVVSAIAAWVFLIWTLVHFRAWDL